MKKRIALILAVTLVLSLVLTGYTAIGNTTDNTLILSVESPYGLTNGKRVLIDENDITVKPIVRNDRTLVPIRFIAENFDCQVLWDENQTITIKGNKTIILTIDSINITVGDTQISLETPPILIGERSYVPLRAISEALGKEVFYDRGLIIISDIKDILDPETNRDEIDELFVKVNSLPIVGTKDQLAKLVENQNQYTVRGLGGKGASTSGMAVMEDATAAPAAVPAPTQSAGAENKTTSTTDYSTTNVQVEGVDEADIIKTDGQYIYRISDSYLNIVDSYPADNMKIVSSMKFDDFYPFEMFVDGNTLVLLGNNQVKYDIPAANQENGFAATTKIMPYYYETTVKAMIFDITDKANIALSRELELEGNYLTSRKIGNYLYFITNKYNWNYYKGEPDQPGYYDSAVSNDKIAIDYGCIRYFPDMEKNTFINIGSINLENYDSEFKVTSYLASGENVYVSNENLYIASTKYTYRPWIRILPATDVIVEPTVEAVEPSLPETNTTVDSSVYDEPKPLPTPIEEPKIEPVKTVIYKFTLDGDNVTYHSNGEVNGQLINQFSMDEYEGHLRVGTTIYDNDPWTNNLFVLDSDMNITGQINNIAPGERIYSTRFLGNRGYMVTFRTTDPLYAMDLSDPKNPKIMGELKIPGYSEYLHPYDETHMIGFGKDAVTDDNNNSFYQGFKMALFDVTDITNPIEMYVENIGDRGTDSPILYDHKSLLFNADKNLLVIPMNVRKVDPNDEYNKNIPAYQRYGQFDLQAAYVYHVDLENGFMLRDKITHMDPKKDGGETYGWEYNQYRNFIDRSLYIGNTLYTSSPAKIQANDLTTLTPIKTVVFPYEQPKYNEIMPMVK